MITYESLSEEEKLNLERFLLTEGYYNKFIVEIKNNNICTLCLKSECNCKH